MTFLLLSLLACGGDEPLDQPNAPPTPPPVYAVVEADVARYTGLATEIHGPTRSFVLTGEGKRVLAMLAETATLRIGGKPSQVQDLVEGATLHVEGRRDGDTLLVLRATDTREEAAVVPVPATEIAAPDGAAPGVEAAAPDGAAPGVEAAAPDVAAPAVPTEAPAP